MNDDNETLGRVIFRHGQPQLCQLTLTGEGNNWIYVNPNYVVSVTPARGYTELELVTGTSMFKRQPLKVKETADIVLQRLAI